MACGGFRQQRPIDEQRRNERLGLDRGQLEAGHEAVVVQPLDLLAERQECLARDLTDSFAILIVLDVRRGQPHIAADGHHLRDPAKRDLQSNFLDDIGDGALEQRNLQIVAMPPEIQLLSKPDRAKRIDARDRSAGRGAAASGSCFRRRLPPGASRPP